MSVRQLGLLAAAAVAAAGLAAAVHWAGRDAAPAAGAPLLPELDGRLDAVDAVRIVGAGDVPVATLRRTPAGWQLAERDGHAADAARLRRLLVALAGLERVEAKTADPALYPRLGVEDVAAPGAQGLRVELGGLGAPLALVVGKAAGGGGTWVRRQGERQSYEVRPTLAVERDTALWLERRLVALPAERIRRIAYAPAGAAAWAIERDAAGEDFRVTGLPPGRRPYAPTAANALAEAWSAVDADDVQRSGDDDFAAAPGRVTLTTFDGLRLTLEATAAAGEGRLRLAAAVEPGREVAAAVRAEAEALAARSTGWTYRLPDYRLEPLLRRVDSLLAPP